MSVYRLAAFGPGVYTSYPIKVPAGYKDLIQRVTKDPSLDVRTVRDIQATCR